MLDWSTALRSVIAAQGLAQGAKFVRLHIPEQFWEHFKKRAVEIKNELQEE